MNSSRSSSSSQNRLPSVDVGDVAEPAAVQAKATGTDDATADAGEQAAGTCQRQARRARTKTGQPVSSSAVVGSITPDDENPAKQGGNVVARSKWPNGVVGIYNHLTVEVVDNGYRSFQEAAAAWPDAINAHVQ